MLKVKKDSFKVRDNQRKKVYEAEKCFDALHISKPLASLQDIEGFLRFVYTSDWFQAHFPRVKQFVVKDGRGRSSACGWGYTYNDRGVIAMGAAMKVPRSLRRDWVVLHELAHGIQPQATAWHGPEFCGIYVRLVQQFMGDEAAKVLLRNFHVQRVKYVLPKAAMVGGRWV